MSETVLYISFNLKKGVSVEDFLLASEKLNNEYMSKQKGYISWKQLNEGDLWVDFLTFKTLEDAKRIEESCEPNPFAEEFYSFIDLKTCKVHLFSIEKSYK